jgi:predicted acylesterase/phospholipase RssA
MSFALDALRQSSVFAGLSLETLDAVAESMELCLLAGGEQLFAQGDPGDAAYVVLSGRVRIEREHAGATHLVREAGRGELIGEFTMLTGAPRTASVRAVRQSELGRIPRDRFEALVKRHPSLALGMGRNLARLLGEAPPPPRTRPSATVIVLRPLVPGASLVQAGESLARALGTFGRCALLTGDVAEAALGGESMRGMDDAARGIATARWLQRIESEHDYVVCVTDGKHPVWDVASVQSDLLLDVLAAEATVPPDRAAPGPVVACARDLVVLHAGAYRRPTLAAAYLASRPYGHRHHLRQAEAGDFDRLARHLTGRRIGFALGGGGARGLAHVGFLRAASELGIPIDEIGGTSIGALVSAQWASGMSIEEMTEAHREGWRRHKPHKAWTLPLIGLVRADAMEQMLRPMFGDLDYADCWIDVFACSCNLTAPGMTVHRRGAVVDACMASMAIPGLGPAVTMPDRSLHVDGSLVSNLPAKQLRAGVVVAADVSAAVPRASGYPRTPTTWEIVRDRWVPLAARPYYPSLYHTVLLSTLVSSIREASRVAESADLYFRAPIEHIGLFEFGRLDEAVEVGYRAGMEVLRPWWESRAR